MLDNLLDIEVAYSLLRGGNEDGDKDPIDINYEKLKTDIKVKEVKSNEWLWIQADILLNESPELWLDRCMALRWVKELEHVLKELQKELSCFDLEKRKLKGYCINI